MIKGNTPGGKGLLCLFLSLAFLLSPCLPANTAQGEDKAVAPARDGLGITLDSEEKAWLEKHSVLRVGGPRAFPPFHFFDQAGQLHGMAFDYLRVVMDQIGLKIEIQRELPWAEVLRRAKEKEIDVIPCVAKTPERETFLIFSKPYLSFPLVIISRKDSPFIGGLRDLRGMRVTFIWENMVQEWLKRDQIDIVPHFVGTPLEALKAVSGGLAEAHIENLAAAGYLIEKHGLANLKVAAPTSYQNYDLYFAVRRDWPELASIINKVLDAISPEQQAAIRNSWLSVRYEYGISVTDVLKWILMIVGPVLIAFMVIFLKNRWLLQEITQRVRVEEELRKSEERYRLVFDNAPLGIMHFDSQGVIQDFNDKFAEIMGAPRERILGFNMLEKLKDTAMLQGVKDALHGQIGHFEGHYLSVTGGKTTAIRAIFQRIAHQDAQFLGAVGIFEDISDRRKAEEDRKQLLVRLQQAQKAESLGRMAGAIAHHFNNLLGVVMGYLELALCDLPPNSKLSAALSESMKASHRAAEISRLMLAYLGQTNGRKEPLDLGEVIRETLPLLDVSMAGELHLKTELPLLGPIIFGDAVHIRQILTNLVSNAVEAMEGRQGEILVAVHMVSMPEIHGLQVFPMDWKPKSECYACLSVSDSGCGMDETTREKVFDPFFSTRFTGRGLGLPVVLGLVRAHDGAITVESGPGCGSVFRVFLPLHAPEEALRPMEESSVPVLLPAGRLVLVVDDEPMVLHIAEAMFRVLGCEVLTAAGGLEAVDIFHDRKHEIHLVLLDISMPGMDGWETMAALRSLRPDIPVVLASGYDKSQVTQDACQERPQGYLQKPYQLEDLKVILGIAGGVSTVETP